MKYRTYCVRIFAQKIIYPVKSVMPTFVNPYYLVVVGNMAAFGDTIVHSIDMENYS
jgi:hypothetical protein